MYTYNHSTEQQQITMSSPPSPFTTAALLPRLLVGWPAVFLSHSLTAPQTGRLIREREFDFTDMQLVEGFNRELQELEPSRPYRSQKSLLEVSNMTSDEYYGTNGPSS